MEKQSEQAVTLFQRKFNCAQAVVAVFSDKYGLDEEMVLKLSTPFGGGVRSGELCGAASGAAMVIGLKYGLCDVNDHAAGQLCGEKTKEFMDKFKLEHGSLACRDLKKPEMPDGSGGRAACALLVGRAAELLEEMGY